MECGQTLYLLELQMQLTPHILYSVINAICNKTLILNTVRCL